MVEHKTDRPEAGPPRDDSVLVIEVPQKDAPIATIGRKDEGSNRARMAASRRHLRLGTRLDPFAIDLCIIEDDADQRRQLVRLLRKQYGVIEADGGAAGLVLVRERRPRIVLCDLLMSDMDGIEVCRQIRADPHVAGTYVIILTGCGERATKHLALNTGADDYLVKPFDFDELLARLRNGVRVSRLQERLQRAALTDGLTGMWNYAHFRHLLDREYSRVQRYGGTVSLLMIDLDHFKAINDTYGHECGNAVLISTAQHLTRLVRDIDVVARYGGEEFSVVCPRTNLDEAAALADRIVQTLPQEVRVADVPQLVVTASVGVVSSGDPGVGSVSDLINLGDQALYTGKRLGRNRVTRSDEVESGGDTPVLMQSCEIDRLRKQVAQLSLQSKELCLQSVWALVQALEARDRYSASHSRNATTYATWLVEAAGWPEALRAATANAAMLHDLGKIGVPDSLLQKIDPLTPEEAALVRQVPLITCRILEPLRMFETEILMIRHIRERYDGDGYPDRLKGTSIPIGSRLLTVVEAFDAMTTDRAYRSHRTIEQAVAEIKAQAGAQFDPQFADLLARDAREHYSRWHARVLASRVQNAERREPVAVG
ncbi:Response regulator PleD [Phycisphaerae bacterium RAS1]|nr:Response regulator PleD [Phycisphaerae bacterium RAS1]